MDQRWAVAGGDAHKHTITLAVLDSTGVEIDIATFGIDPQGMVQLLAWLEQLESPSVGSASRARRAEDGRSRSS